MSVQQAAWTQGYRADSEYTFGIYPVLNPDTLLLTAALQGVRPAADIVSSGGKEGRKLVYCELGSGQGLTLNLMAARDPGGSYYGVDYNPNQIRNARAFAEAAGITNVFLSEESFADLDSYDIPDCDVIVMHGIWSWIEPDLQENIIKFITRKLKPGGLVYVSYNCAVGRSSDNPMRRLLIAAERTSVGKNRNERVIDAIKTTKTLSDAGAQFFKSNPVSKQRLEGLLEHEPAYIEQEYLNSAWQNCFFDEVSDAMSRAKLSFVGSTNMASNRLEMALPVEIRDFASRFSNASDLELIKDLWSNNTFRQDIFVRGVQALSPAELNGLLQPLYFSLTRRREDCVLDVKVPGGNAKIPKEPYVAILDALEKSPLSGRQLTDIITKSGVDMSVAGVVGALFAFGFIGLAPTKVAAPRIAQSLAGFESTINDLVAAKHDRFACVIPGLGNIVQLSAINYYFWMANHQKTKKKAAWVLKQLTASGRNVLHNGGVVKDPAKALELIKAMEVSFDLSFKPLMSLGHKV